LPASRLAISASRKVGNAVVRNKIRRRVKAEFYINRKMLNAGMDIIIFPRKICYECRIELLRADAQKAIEYLKGHK